MSKLFLFAVLVSLIFAVPLAFAEVSESAASDSGASVGASSASPASDSVASSGATAAASSESKGGAVSSTGASTSSDGGSVSSTGTGVKGDVAPSPSVKPAPAPSPAVKPNPTSLPPANDIAPTPLPAVKPKPTSLPPIKDTSPKPLPAVKPNISSSTDPSATTTYVYSVEVLPPSANLTVGQTQQFIALLVVNGAVLADVPFTWSETGGVGNVTQNGLFTATALGSGSVVATYNVANLSVSGSAFVLVSNSTSPPPPPGNNSTAFSLFIVPPTATLNIGDTQQFTVYASLSNGSMVQVSDSLLAWATAGGIGSVNSTGFFTATAAGNGTVFATYSGPMPANASNVVTAYVSVNSSPPPPPGNQSYTLLISPVSATLMVGATQQFVGQLYDANGTYVMDLPNSDLSWLSSDTTVGTIDALGMFSAISPGSALVKAAYIGTAYANVTSQNLATVTVGSAPPPANVSYILVTPNPAALFTGQSQQFIATAYDAGNASLGVLPNANLIWSVDNATVGTIDASGTFSALAAGSAVVNATYGSLTANASVTVSQFVPNPIGGGGSSGGSNGNGGSSFKTSTTVSFSCAGKAGTVKITVYDSAVKNATVDIFYMGGSQSQKVFSKEITGTTTIDFAPQQAGDYTMHVTVGTDQTSANFFVPYCGPQTANVTQNITVNLAPSRELVFSKLVYYPGGFSKRFSVYKITNGQTESFESDIVLYLNYTGNSTKYDFDILDSVPSSVLARASQITFADRPSVVSSEPKFEWHVKSVSKGGRLSYAYSFSRPLTEQMIALFDAPTIREAATGTPSTPAQSGGLLAASIGPIFGLQLPLVGVVLAFIVLLSLLYFFLFRKKEEE